MSGQLKRFTLSEDTKQAFLRAFEEHIVGIRHALAKPSEKGPEDPQQGDNEAAQMSREERLCRSYLDLSRTQKTAVWDGVASEIARLENPEAGEDAIERMRKDLVHYFNHNTMQAMYKGDIEKRRAAIVAETRDFLDHHGLDVKKFTGLVKRLRETYQYDSDTNGKEIFPESIRNAAQAAKTSWKKEHDSSVPPKRQQCCKGARTSADKCQNEAPFDAVALLSNRQACDSAMRAGARRINALPIPEISVGTCR